MVCKKCGSNRLYAHQVLRADIICDGEGAFEENPGGDLTGAVYDAEKPYGPFTCTGCGEEYDELETVAADGTYQAISYGELAARFRKHEATKPKVHLTAHIVFRERSWDREYPLSKSDLCCEQRQQSVPAEYERLQHLWQQPG